MACYRFIPLRASRTEPYLFIVAFFVKECNFGLVVLKSNRLWKGTIGSESHTGDWVEAPALFERAGCEVAANGI